MIETTSSSIDCYPDTLWVTKNDCLDEDGFTGIYHKLPKGEWPKTISIGLDQGDAEAGFDSGIFIRVDEFSDNSDTQLNDTVSCYGSSPIYQRFCNVWTHECLDRQYIYGAMIDNSFKWVMSGEHCATTDLSYVYDPTENNDVQNFWELEAPILKRNLSGVWIESQNQRFEEGPEGWAWVNTDLDGGVEYENSTIYLDEPYWKAEYQIKVNSLTGPGFTQSSSVR